MKESWRAWDDQLIAYLRRCDPEDQVRTALEAGDSIRDDLDSTAVEEFAYAAGINLKDEDWHEQAEGMGVVSLAYEYSAEALEEICSSTVADLLQHLLNDQNQQGED